MSLDAGDVVHGDEGLVVTLRRSKGDQEGRGATKGVPFASLPAVCPVRPLARWLEASRIAEGPIFRGIDRHGTLAHSHRHLVFRRDAPERAKDWNEVLQRVERDFIGSLPGPQRARAGPER